MQCIYSNLLSLMYNLSRSLYLDGSLSFISGYLVIVFFKYPHNRVSMHHRSNLTGQEHAEPAWESFTFHDDVYKTTSMGSIAAQFHILSAKSELLTLSYI